MQICDHLEAGKQTFTCTGKKVMFWVSLVPQVSPQIEAKICHIVDEKLAESYAL